MGSIRSIVVHLDGTPRCALRLRAARELASQLDARVTALFGIAPGLADAPYAYTAGAVSVQSLQESHNRWRSSAMDMFDREAALGGDTWAELTGVDLIAAFAEQARYADLLVLGQHDRTDAIGQQVPGDFIESVLIRSGRPALVIPCAGRFASVTGSTVLVAWTPSAESARAVTAALPVLRRATQVHIAAWDRNGPQRCDGERLDIERYLALHGVRPTMHVWRSEPRHVGDAMLSLVSDLGAQLLVMGCYGHSRAREFVLGGATRTVLQSMTVPVLMSH